VVDFVSYWANRFSCITAKSIISSLNIYPARFHEWKHRYGQINKHNGHIPRHHWLFQDEKDAIINFYTSHFEDGYRRCTYMMIDQNIVYCSPSTVYRVLHEADVIRRWNRKPSKKGQGFIQPLEPHKHWHIDISYVNVGGTFYYLITVLDGFSRYIVHTDLRESMKDIDIQIVIQKAKELFPDAKPTIISDNGKQFIAQDFKGLLRHHGMKHVKTAPYYPQSNGKIERFHKTIKHECIRPSCAQNIHDAKRLIKKYVKEYNEVRLHSAIAYITPKDKLEGRAEMIQNQRDHKLEQGRIDRIERSKRSRTYKDAI